MDLIPAIVLIAAASTYASTVPCRLLLTRQRQPSWLIGLLVALIVGALTVLFIFQIEVFQPSRWDTAKVHVGYAMLFVFVIATVIACLPAFIVVGYYRDKYAIKQKQV